MSSPRSNWRCSVALSVLMAQAAVIAPLPAQAQQQQFAIAPQPLGPALLAFSQAAGLRLIAPSSLLAGRRSGGVSGSIGKQAALNQLLAGTGLIGQIENGTITVLAPARSAAAGDVAGGITLDTVVLSSASESAYGPVDGIAAEASASGTKTDTPIIETPQSVYVVPAAQLEKTGATNLPDALAYTPGVSQTYGYTMRTGDQVQMRGFEVGNTMRDGMTYSINTFDGQQEPYGLERIEVLKGAASVLYGNLRPGGMVNTVSKRPPSEPLHEVNVELGSHARRQISGDVGGPLDADGVWSYRLTGLYRDSDTFLDHVRDDRRFVAGALRWQPDDATSLTFLAEYQKDNTASFSAMLPPEGVVLPNINGTIPRNRFMGEPDYDRYRVERWTLGYQLDHELNDTFRVHQGLRYYATNQDNRFLMYDTLAADQRTVTRSGQDRDEQTWGITTDTSLQADLTQGALHHTALVGVDYSRLRVTTRRYARTAGDLDIFDPVYGTPVSPRVPSYGWGDTTKQLGLYAQDQIKIGDRWVLVVGGRQDWVTQRSIDPFTGAVTVDNEKSDAFTGRAGLVYLAPNGLAPYLSFSQSFEPVTGFNRQHERFKPTMGEQYEVGLRYQPPGGDTLISVALYQLTQKNGLTTDPEDTDFSVQMGKTRARGIEIEARTALTDSTNMIAAYSYTDAKTLDGGPMAPELAGQRVGGVPRNMASLWVDHNFEGSALPGLTIGAGIRYVGSVQANWADFTVPSYTLVDAMASYQFDDWKMTLNVNNLFDKSYASCPNVCFWGEPRRIALTATRNW